MLEEKTEVHQHRPNDNLPTDSARITLLRVALSYDDGIWVNCHWGNCHLMQVMFDEQSVIQPIVC